MITLNLLKSDASVRRRVSRIKASSRYWENHKEEVKTKRRKRQDQNTEYRKKWRLENVYGISVREYEEILLAQKGACAVCPRTDGLHVDHDHKTGKVRGLLCGSHNRAIGLAGDSPETLRAMAIYLEKQNGEAARD